MGEATSAEARVTRLVFDVGNTRIKAAGVRLDGERPPPTVFAGAVASDDWLHALERFPQALIAVASVNPGNLRRLLDETAKRGRTVAWTLQSGSDLFRLKFADHNLRAPETVGVDRVLGCLGALRLAKDGAIVVDCGTAATVNVMSADRRFLGGMIAPGRALLAESLRAGTAQLPSAPPDVLRIDVGTATDEAIRAGVSAALVGGVEKMAAAAQTLLPNAEVFLTGGDAERVSAAVTFPHRTAPTLVLDGLFDVFELWLQRRS